MIHGVPQLLEQGFRNESSMQVLELQILHQSASFEQ
jgi:hypothetical protein